MRLLRCLVITACMILCLVGAALPQTVTSPAQQPLGVQSAFSSNTYSSANPVTYTKTATGLQVVIAPSTLSGPGSLAGHQFGLVMEIPDFFIQMIFN